MNNLPIAASIATQLVERQFRYDEPAEHRPAVRPERRPIRTTRIALAAALEHAARAVAPRGHRLAL